jgi:hypothetical protein
MAEPNIERMGRAPGPPKRARERSPSGAEGHSGFSTEPETPARNRHAPHAHGTAEDRCRAYPDWLTTWRAKRAAAEPELRWRLLLQVLVMSVLRRALH